MAFDAPLKTTAISALHKVNAEYESSHNWQNHSQQQQRRASSRVPNLLRQLTISLKATYAEVSTAGFIRKGVPSFPTNEHGELIVTPTARPVLDKRYSLHRMIAKGTFSQIFSAQCSQSLRTVAIKVMRIGYDILGRRENALLLLLNKKCGVGPQYFAEVISSFDFDDHFSIVMAQYHTTLLALIDQSSTSSRPTHSSKGQLQASSNSSSYQAFTPQATGSNIRIVKPVPGSSGIKRSVTSTHSSPAAEGGSAAAAFAASIAIDPLLLPNQQQLLQLHQQQQQLKQQPPTFSFDRKCVERVRRIALHMVSALFILKQEGIIHADLKPENCFIASESGIGYVKSEFDQQQYQQQYQQQSQYQEQYQYQQHQYQQHQPFQIFPHLMARNNNRIQQPDYSFLPLQQQQQQHFGTIMNLHTLPEDFSIRLGDFGNAIHVSEVSDYYEEFVIQSLPYRAPEVLIGLPFSHAIDMWSLGVLLVEIVSGESLFKARDREEMVRMIAQKLSPMPQIRFSGGKFSDVLFSESIIDKEASSADRLKAVRRLLLRRISEEQRHLLDPSLLHFVTSLLSVDPEKRLTPIDALKHPFLAPLVPVPVSIFNAPTVVQTIEKSRRIKCSASVRSLRSLRSDSEPPLKRKRIAALMATNTSVSAPIDLVTGFKRTLSSDESHERGDSKVLCLDSIRSKAFPVSSSSSSRSVPMNTLEMEWKAAASIVSIDNTNIISAAANHHDRNEISKHVTVGHEEKLARERLEFPVRRKLAPP